MSYVDGFLEACRSMAKKATKVWKHHGALEFRESVLAKLPGL
jgi:uncharacterized protein YbaA (DUF1428 family)